MPQVLRGDRTHGRVTVSCQVNDVDVAWQLAADGEGTVIEVRVEVSDAEVARLPMLETMMANSVVSLAALAEAEAEPSGQVSLTCPDVEPARPRAAGRPAGSRRAGG